MAMRVESLNHRFCMIFKNKPLYLKALHDIIILNFSPNPIMLKIIERINFTWLHINMHMNEIPTVYRSRIDVLNMWFFQNNSAQVLFWFDNNTAGQGLIFIEWFSLKVK